MSFPKLSLAMRQRIYHWLLPTHGNTFMVTLTFDELSHPLVEPRGALHDMRSLLLVNTQI
jgi:hypothetical protein